MTITLDLAPASEALLTGIANQEGQDKTKIASLLLAAALEQAARERDVQAILLGWEDSPAGRLRPVTVWDAEFRAKYNIPADREPLSEEELRLLNTEDEAEAIRLGLEDSFAGRMTPSAEWKTRFHARHNIPEGGQPMSHEEANLIP